MTRHARATDFSQETGHPSLRFAEAGIVLGAGILLARRRTDALGLQRLMLEADAGRCLALLSVAYRKSVPAAVIGHLAAAADHWERGDTALAHLRLAFAGLPQFRDTENTERLTLAERLLDGGMAPRNLMKELGLDPCHVDLLRTYDPEQPRVPAGSGRSSGQWSSGDVESATASSASPRPTTGDAPETTHNGTQQPSEGRSASAASAIALPGAAAEGVGTLASGLFAAAEGSELLAGLAALGATSTATAGGAAAVFGTIFIPSPNNVVSESAVPGDPALRYSLNSDNGTLRFLHDGETGPELVAVAQLGRDGIFYETETGIPVARNVGGNVVLDPASLATIPEQAPTSAGATAQTDADADTEDEDPQLCPAPAKDTPHGASERAIAYEQLISALNNPQRPLPPRWGVSLTNPATGRRVYFDDCRESDGTMIEAKGPGYANLLRYRYFSDRIFPYRWTNQATRQVSAAGSRDVDWFFAEDSAATKANDVFSKTPALRRINVLTVPAEVK